MENEPPVLLDPWPQLRIIEESSSVRQQAVTGECLVQFNSQHAQVALVLLLLAFRSGELISIPSRSKMVIDGRADPRRPEATSVKRSR
jgi:hypothetical protein